MVRVFHTHPFSSSEIFGWVLWILPEGDEDECSWFVVVVVDVIGIRVWWRDQVEQCFARCDSQKARIPHPNCEVVVTDNAPPVVTVTFTNGRDEEVEVSRRETEMNTKTKVETKMS